MEDKFEVDKNANRERDFSRSLIVIKARDSKTPKEVRGPSGGEEATVWRTTLKGSVRGFPGGAVVKNPPANEGDTGSSPGPGRSHMLWSN